MIKKLVWLGIIGNSILIGLFLVQFEMDFKAPPSVEIPNIFIDTIRAKQSGSFLENCEYFRSTWPSAYALLTGGTFSVDIKIPNRSPASICGEYKPLGNFILLYPNSFYDFDCRGANPMHVLSHEMLHALGLPVHKFKITDPRYFLFDSIEVTMSECTMETAKRGERLSWDREYVNKP